MLRRLLFFSPDGAPSGGSGQPGAGGAASGSSVGGGTGGQPPAPAAPAFDGGSFFRQNWKMPEAPKRPQTQAPKEYTPDAIESALQAERQYGEQMTAHQRQEEAYNRAVELYAKGLKVGDDLHLPFDEASARASLSRLGEYTKNGISVEDMIYLSRRQDIEKALRERGARGYEESLKGGAAGQRRASEPPAGNVTIPREGSQARTGTGSLQSANINDMFREIGVSEKDLLLNEGLMFKPIGEVAPHLVRK